jgi:uncharacterized cupredoxin-like copper-binding protein
LKNFISLGHVENNRALLNRALLVVEQKEFVTGEAQDKIEVPVAAHYSVAILPVVFSPGLQASSKDIFSIKKTRSEKSFNITHSQQCAVDLITKFKKHNFAPNSTSGYQSDMALHSPKNSNKLKKEDNVPKSSKDSQGQVDWTCKIR